MKVWVDTAVGMGYSGTHMCVAPHLLISHAASPLLLLLPSDVEQQLRFWSSATSLTEALGSVVTTA
jgi:hypothetical protein